jgi:hypothetical protein
VPIAYAAKFCRRRQRPDHPERRRILRDRGIFVIPDILANPGGVTVSYFEWVQGLRLLFWKEHEVYQRLREVMIAAFAQVLTVSQERKCDLRTTALILGIDEIAKATLARGMFPSPFKCVRSPTVPCYDGTWRNGSPSVTQRAASDGRW